MVIRSVLLGVGLAMDAFSVSIADGLSEQNMNKGKMLLIAGTFAAFQFAMPMTGWWLVSTAVDRFRELERFIPWIALILLAYIGGSMLMEGIAGRRGSEAAEPDGPGSAEPGSTGSRLTAGALLVQGVATSIDALSVGFTIEQYGIGEAVISSLIIGVVTLGICLAGLLLGRRIGSRLTGRADILGGVILIAIGLEIWIKGVFL